MIKKRTKESYYFQPSSRKKYNWFIFYYFEEISKLTRKQQANIQQVILVYFCLIVFVISQLPTIFTQFIAFYCHFVCVYTPVVLK